MNNTDKVEQGKSFLFKSMKKEYLQDTIKKGRFCFNHPSVFNKWENTDSAQFDRYDSYSSYTTMNIVVAPLLSDTEDKIQYGTPFKIADEAVMHLQSPLVAHSPICCFRSVLENEYTIEDNTLYFTLGETAKRIMSEFGHDSYVMIPSAELKQLMLEKGVIGCGSVIYKNTLNDFDFGDIKPECKDIIEQLFRKDERFEWQREYRFVLPPSKNSPQFIELGTIENISIYGQLSDLIN